MDPGGPMPACAWIRPPGPSRRRCTRPSAAGAAAQKYLKGREMADEAAKEFSIGYSLPAWDGLLRHFERNGIKPELAEKKNA